MNYFIRITTAIIIFTAILIITAPLKAIFCIWDWKCKIEPYFEYIFRISFNIVDLDS